MIEPGDISQPLCILTEFFTIMITAIITNSFEFEKKTYENTDLWFQLILFTQRGTYSMNHLVFALSVTHGSSGYPDTKLLNQKKVKAYNEAL